MRAVIIDDEPMAVEILENYCRKTPNLELAAGFNDPVEALAYLQQEPVDLLFLDINMPDLTGIQLIKALARPPRVILRLQRRPNTLRPMRCLASFTTQDNITPRIWAKRWLYMKPQSLPAIFPHATIWRGCWLPPRPTWPTRNAQPN